MGTILLLISSIVVSFAIWYAVGWEQGFKEWCDISEEYYEEQILLLKQKYER